MIDWMSMIIYLRGTFSYITSVRKFHSDEMLKWNVPSSSYIKWIHNLTRKEIMDIKALHHINEGQV